MFRFKQFIVDDALCAMKVGTDGVLLGAWAEHPMPTTILDIGTGSGLIALMLAQRFTQATILGIDIDEDSVAAAERNFSASPWGERLTAFRCTLQEYRGNTTTASNSAQAPLPNHIKPSTFSLIVSNPPYFQNSLRAPDRQRNIARHTDTLSYQDLVSHAARLLSADGIFAVIVPATERTTLITLAAEERLQPIHITLVHSKEGKEAKRAMLAFRRTANEEEILKESLDHHETYNNEAIEDTLIEDTLILDDGYGGRSTDYRRLTEAFYL